MGHTVILTQKFLDFLINQMVGLLHQHEQKNHSFTMHFKRGKIVNYDCNG